MAKDPLEVPQSDVDDAGHTAVTLVLGMIPFAGGMAVEGFKQAVPPPIERRRDKWMQCVSDSIRELQARKGFTIEELRNNDEFISLLLQTTRAALNSHLTAKHALLKNALVNAMSLDMAFDSKQLLVSMVDRFTPSHVAILSIVNRTKNLTVHITSGGQYYDALKKQRELITLTVLGIPFLGFLEDLHKAGLLVISNGFIISDGDVHQQSLRRIHTDDDDRLPKLNLTDFGYSFLSFVDSQK
jgi:hypothetical protein